MVLILQIISNLEGTLNSGKMKKHLEKAHGIKQFHCTYCYQSFGMKGNLKKHIDEVHENIRPFECEICQGKFARKEKLREHIEGVHEKIKPFQCSSCDYRSHLKGMAIQSADVFIGVMKASQTFS